MFTFSRFYILIIGLSIVSCNTQDNSDDYINWSVYRGDKSASHYSISDEINTENVKNLKPAWTYSSGDKDPKDRSQIQCNPLVINGVLYGTSAKLKLFALDAAAGKELWQFDPFDTEFSNFGMGLNRGLIYHENGSKKRIIYSAGPFVYSINAADGIPDKNFGDNGKIDLHKGLDRDVDSLFILSNTPGIIYKNLLIQGSRVSESTGPVPGHVRAYDVNTGEQKWIFHTIPHPGEYGADSWPQGAYERSGGANVWGGFSLDEQRGIVYCGTGSASFDFYGGDRHGMNLFANSILALDARTGKRKWHFQTVHHDIWDKDIPTAPNLVTVEKDGKKIDCVAQITKNGLLFVLDRVTGEPLYPIEEVSVAPSDLDGEQAWPTQPVPTVFPKFSRFQLTEGDLATRNQEAADFAKKVWKAFKPAHPYAPLSIQGTFIFPGLDGGGEWGGAAYDPIDGNLIINSMDIVWNGTMAEVVPATPGQQLYNSFCQNCHGEKFGGSEFFGNVPALTNLNKRMTLTQVNEIVKKGRGVMPPVSYLTDVQIESIYKYINGLEGETEKILDENWPYPYRYRGYDKLYAPDGYPMINPPWGQLTSMNLNEKKINWQVPLGEYEELTKLGIPITGTEQYGGPILTAGGLIFIAATMDEKIRAFDKKTGEELWSYKLPAGGYATPTTYSIQGKQYLVIACGGGKLRTKSGDEYVAFAL